MITEQQHSFIDALGGEMPTPEQAAQLLELGEGDTAMAETGSAPNATAALESAPTNTDNRVTDDSEINADNAVILAKDGKHTISFDKLVEARQSAQQYRLQAEAAQAELAKLQAEAQARLVNGQAATLVDNQVAAAQAAIDAGEDPSLFGDFSEEQLAAGIQKLIDSQVEQKVNAALSKTLEPIQRQQQTEATNAHYSAIYDKHPDADSIAESKELADWIESQPSFVQSGYRGVLESGTTSEVIELFDRFKAAINRADSNGAGEPSNADLKARAKAAVSAATIAPPTSLSDIPGGRPSGATREEAMASMTGPEMLEQMASMSPQQIESFMNRSL